MQSKDWVPCEKNAPRPNPNQRGHAVRDFAGLIPILSPFLEKKSWCRSVKSAGARYGAPPQPLSAKDFFSFQHPELARRPLSTRPRVWDSLAKRVPIKSCHFCGGLAAARSRKSACAGGIEKFSKFLMSQIDINNTFQDDSIIFLYFLKHFGNS